MSVESWIEEFYPILAQDIVRRSDDPLVLTKHSLQKWKGFLPKNLEKHSIGEEDVLEVQSDVSSCALCQKYLDGAETYLGNCKKCPLYQLRGAKCYDGTQSPAVYSSKIDCYGRPQFPEKTIKGLEDTILMLEKKNAAHSKNSTVQAGISDQEDRSTEQESSEARRIPHISDVYPD